MAEQVGGIYYDVDLDTKRMLDAEKKVGKSLGRMGDEGDKLQARFSKIAAAVSAAIGAIAIEGLISKVVTAQRQFDVMFASLKTMTGGVNNASIAWERLVKFAATTPYTLEQSVQGFTKLKALGLDPGERAMTSYGNTAAAMGKNLMQMIEAVADASTGEFERLKEFGIKAKVEGDKVSLTFQGVTTTIGNNAQAITDYLIKIGETEFGGAMSERMKTLDGDISNLQDSLAALYLSISQSGFGEAIAQGVRAATEAIQEATASIKNGGLTDYFERLIPYINAAEVAASTLAAVVAGRLLAAFVAAAAQAYAAATAIGAATLAARGFAGVVALLGGPIGIAVTGLALLALNWDKVAGSAKDAAQVSEDAAKRIENALKKGPNIATAELSAQLAEYQKDLGSAKQALTNLKVGTYGKGDAKDIADAQAKVDALQAAIERVKTAMVEAYSPGPREATSLPPPEPPAKKPDAPKAKKDSFDGAAYVAGLAREVATEYEKVDVVEREALRKNDQLLAQKKITTQQHQQAITLIEKNAAQDRAEIARKQSEEAIARQIEYGAAEEANATKAAEGRKRALENAARINAAGDPVAQAQLQYEMEMQQLDANLQAGYLLQSEYAEARVNLELETAARMREITEREAEARLAAEAATANMQLAMAGGAAGQLLDLLQRAGKERSGLAKAAFLAERAIAAATIIINTEVAAAKAQGQLGIFGIPMATLIRATGYASAGMVAGMAIGEVAGGRQYGGPTSAGSLYRVNETGAPEMFTGSNGSQYMLGTQSGRVTPADELGGKAPTVIIQNMGPPLEVQSQTFDQQSNTIRLAVRQAKAELTQEVRDNTGAFYGALRSSTNLGPRQ